MGSVLLLNEIKIQCDILFPTCWGRLISKAGKNSRLLFVSNERRFRERKSYNATT